jgi:hypothetical protein
VAYTCPPRASCTPLHTPARLLPGERPWKWIGAHLIAEPVSASRWVIRRATGTAAALVRAEAPWLCRATVKRWRLMHRILLLQMKHNGGDNGINVRERALMMRWMY